MLTYDQFAATRTRSENLERDIQMDDTPFPGYVYDNSCAVEEHPEFYQLMIYNEIWTRPKTESGLVELQRLLYDNFYVHEVGPYVR